MSIPVVSNAGRRRSAVSAESMSPAAIKEKYSKVVYDKSAEHRTALADILKENFLFRGLESEAMTTLLDAMFMSEFKAGDVIIEQGAEGDNFYVVFEGSCEVYVAKGGEEAAQVASYAVGGSFGELALMYNAPRAATVKACTDAVLWAVDRVTFRQPAEFDRDAQSKLETMNIPYMYDPCICGLEDTAELAIKVGQHVAAR